MQAVASAHNKLFAVCISAKDNPLVKKEIQVNIVKALPKRGAGPGRTLDCVLLLLTSSLFGNKTASCMPPVPTTIENDENLCAFFVCVYFRHYSTNSWSRRGA